MSYIESESIWMKSPDVTASEVETPCEVDGMPVILIHDDFQPIAALSLRAAKQLVSRLRKAIRETE